MSEHTPRPWYVDSSDTSSLMIMSEDHGLVVEVDKADDRSEGDANLIAAAPDLQHAVSLVLRDLYDQGILLQDDTEKALISAINKSKGK